MDTVNVPVAVAPRLSATVYVNVDIPLRVAEMLTELADTIDPFDDVPIVRPKAVSTSGISLSASVSLLVRFIAAVLLQNTVAESAFAVGGLFPDGAGVGEGVGLGVGVPPAEQFENAPDVSDATTVLLPALS